MSAGTVRAQRAAGAYLGSGALLEAVGAATAHRSTAHDTPVLVIPEAAVRGCTHYDDEAGLRGKAIRDMDHAWCVECGAWWNGVRWQRPRILRVAKERTK